MNTFHNLHFLESIATLNRSFYGILAILQSEGEREKLKALIRIHITKEVWLRYRDGQQICHSNWSRIHGMEALIHSNGNQFGATRGRTRRDSDNESNEQDWQDNKIIELNSCNDERTWRMIWLLEWFYCGLWRTLAYVKDWLGCWRSKHNLQSRASI